MSPTMTLKALALLAASLVVLPTPVAAGPIFNMPDLADRVHELLNQHPNTDIAPPASTLPAPTEGLSLKYVGLGLGTQNYTCAGVDPSAAPKAVGAAATLHDATGVMATMANTPLYGQSRVASMGTCAADKDNSAGVLPVIGHHFFDAAGTPTFDLAPVGLLLKSKKMGSCAAPTDACLGRDGAAAVAWLMLNDDGTDRSKGLSQVFRVETVGGSAPATCEGITGAFEKDYAAYYFLYGQ